LDQIINSGPLADNRVGTGAPVDSGIRTDRYVVFDDDSADLRNVDMRTRLAFRCETESVLTDPDAREKAYPRAYDAVAETASGPYADIVADRDASSDHGLWADVASRADRNIRLDHREIVYPAVRPDLGRRVDRYRPGDPRIDRGDGIEGPAHTGEREIRRFRNQQRHAGRRFSRIGRSNQAGSRRTDAEAVRVAPVFEETYVAGPCGVKRRHVCHFAFRIGVGSERRTGDFRDRAERKRTDTMEKAGIRHAQLVDLGVLFSVGSVGSSFTDGRLLSIRRRTSPVMSSF
ncbi:MAG: hypothetical protein OXI64_09580, partial [Defluviicoccus sp.]|nr:hypothetical protein [Defluviicoccus sp.]